MNIFAIPIRFNYGKYNNDTIKGDTGKNNCPVKSVPQGAAYLSSEGRNTYFFT